MCHVPVDHLERVLNLKEVMEKNCPLRANAYADLKLSGYAVNCIEKNYPSVPRDPAEMFVYTLERTGCPLSSLPVWETARAALAH